MPALGGYSSLVAWISGQNNIFTIDLFISFSLAFTKQISKRKNYRILLKQVSNTKDLSNELSLPNLRVFYLLLYVNVAFALFVIALLRTLRCRIGWFWFCFHIFVQQPFEWQLFHQIYFGTKGCYGTFRSKNINNFVLSP